MASAAEQETCRQVPESVLGGGAAGASGSGSAGGGDGSHVIICSAAGVGCSGRLRLLLTWRCASQPHPDISADLALDPLQVACDPTALPLCLHELAFRQYCIHHSSCAALSVA